MKVKYALALAALLLFALPASADQIVDYTLTVVNAPLSGADFSWTIQTDGFIQPVPDPVYQCIEYCNESSEHWIRECVEYCGDTNYFTSFIAVSEPSSGDCAISKLFLAPDEATTTFFSPLCDGMYDGFVGGSLPDPGVLGTWSWQGTNPNDTENYVTLTITDPVGASMPEPGEIALLAPALFGLGFIRRRSGMSIKARLS